MATLVFDIETVGEDWESLDDTTKKVLTRWVDRTARTSEERALGYRDIQEGLGFSPLTGEIVAIGLYDVERAQGVVYYRGEVEEDVDHENFILKSRTEKEMLEDFWEGAKSYDTFVTFNGRGFDIPFLNIRSVTHGIRPTQQLLSGRYLYQQKHVRHVDLQDQLTFYGATRRKPPLHVFCRAFGIQSPKDGMEGDDIAELFRMKKFRDIATYNARDVVATTELYKKWLKHLAPEGFSDEPTRGVL